MCANTFLPDLEDGIYPHTSKSGPTAKAAVQPSMLSSGPNHVASFRGDSAMCRSPLGEPGCLGFGVSWGCEWGWIDQRAFFGEVLESKTWLHDLFVLSLFHTYFCFLMTTVLYEIGQQHQWFFPQIWLEWVNYCKGKNAVLVDFYSL